MPGSNLTIGFVGCGTGAMGSAVLIGLLNAIYPEDGATRVPELFRRYLACTATEAEASALRKKLDRHQTRVEVTFGDVGKVIEQADVVVLGVKPYMASQLLSTGGVAEALRGKLAISMLAGVSIDTLRGRLPHSAAGSTGADPIYWTRAVPNLAASFGQSITVVQVTEPSLPADLANLQDRIFSYVGTVKYLAENLMDLGTVLNTAGMTMVSVALEGLLDGSVASGMRRNDAMDVVLQGIRGFASILENGTHPATMRENAASPRGCTIQTLIGLEQAGVRGTYATALVKGAEHFRQAK
ncbi:unnamed protein product [Clonostachys solani]|uniref:Pyrroline-5-carboxylate reductase n=1 Tax=Clonostachys solani TaxID=160281 RepID=A0A9N9W5Q7_9HYPO|nr:unnamed protein product [Clonostachys solani]